MPLILASHSPRRKEILALLGISFSIHPAHIPEELETVEDALRLSEEKAREILGRFPDATVLGADTIVSAEGHILGKPRDLEDAQRMLRLLSGKTHSVFTAFTLLSGEKNHSELVETRIQVTSLSEEEIWSYTKEENVLDAAGAYKIQGCFAQFVERIEGDYLNVVGLPLHRIYQALKNFAI